MDEEIDYNIEFERIWEEIRIIKEEKRRVKINKLIEDTREKIKKFFLQ